MAAKNYLDILRNEFEAGNDSFLIQLRGDLVWSKQAFAHLVSAMQDCCLDLEGAERVDRWLANGFWYVAWFVESWTAHGDFPRKFPDQYYKDAYLLLSELASYFFTGEHPRLDRRFRLPE